MTTNRDYKSRTATEGLDKWILDKLLYGECEPKIRFYLSRPEFGGNCLCNVYPEIWEKIRDKVLPQWRKQHPDGALPWAEMQREKGL